MIRNLLDRMLTLADLGFGAMLADPETQLVIGPLAAAPTTDLPRIALYSGTFKTSRTARELRSSAPRPMEIREELAIDNGNPQGPYDLGNTPLDGSMLAKLVFDQGEVSERRRLIQEGATKDYQIDYANATISLNETPTGASHLQLVYSHVGVFTLLEFEQIFFADVYHDDTVALTQFSTLLSSMILTNQDELIEHFNLTDPTTFSGNQYQAQIRISRIDCLGGDYFWEESTPRHQLSFEVQGEFRPIKLISDGFGLIEQIRSPGVSSDEEIDIEIGLE